MWCNGCQRGQTPINGRCPDCGRELASANPPADQNPNSFGTITVNGIDLGGGYDKQQSYEDSAYIDEVSEEPTIHEKPKKKRGRKKKKSSE